eukprot:COSAG02_NODE_16765_length_1057_cov_1.121086_1_plen_161_part_10
MPEDAERFPVEEANDHIVWAFFRSGQYWRNAEFVAKEPRSCEVVESDSSLIIVAGAGDKLIKFPQFISSSSPDGDCDQGSSPILSRAPSSFKYTTTSQNFSVTVVGEDSRPLLALWKKDTPFYQKWGGTVEILATPVNPSEQIDTDADAEFEMTIGTVKVE